MSENKRKQEKIQGEKSVQENIRFFFFFFIPAGLLSPSWSCMAEVKCFSFFPFSLAVIWSVTRGKTGQIHELTKEIHSCVLLWSPLLYATHSVLPFTGFLSVLWLITCVYFVICLCLVCFEWEIKANTGADTINFYSRVASPVMVSYRRLHLTAIFQPFPSLMCCLRLI